VLGELAVGSLAITGIAIGLGRWINPPAKPVEIAGKTITPEATNPIPTGPPTNVGFKPVPGTRPETTPIEDFYRVDINLLPPGDSEFLDSSDPFVQRLLAQGGETDLPADSYILLVDGLVKNPLSLSLEDLKSYPMVEQFATLECISNPIGGDLISTTTFQGTRLNDILETAELNPSVIDIKFTSVDGYSESLPVQAAFHPETLLCYSMGNQALTKVHGAPLRLYTPDRFGIKNPKWLIKIEAIDRDYRGIQSVELRVNEGEWRIVDSDRPLSPLTWVLWRASLDLPSGEHEITVRAIDSEGEIQTERKSSTHPNGATGYHSKTITI
jgi:DMSO/TMAO reductase YedYZ molybdopterin-dependent catalytic subunit